ncbi:kinase-like protein [Dentipellis sp. KUC8613]|nr:kinase-like protein [Dentipellis sp. KUC8613]
MSKSAHSKEPKTNLVGKTIDNGSLLLRGVLGSGAYGVVYRAIDTRSARGTEYAVKCLDKSKMSKSVAHHMRELTLHASVTDLEGVVGMHRAFESAEHLFIVFDLCLGGDLFAAVTGDNIFWRNDALVKKIMLQLIDAVDACHRREVYHRDIKPENILISKDRTKAWLADFGLATSHCVTEDFGCGSSFYMSPECRGREFNVGPFSSRHSDIWALGIVLINMLTGRNPWRNASSEDDCFAAYLHEPDFFLHMFPISRPANALLRRILALNPLSRMTLRDMRTEVKGMATFFMTDRELRRAHRFAQECARTLNGEHQMRMQPKPAPIPIPIPVPVPAHVHAARSAPSPRMASPRPGSLDPADSEEFYVFSSPNPDSPCAPPRPFTFVRNPPMASRLSTETLESVGPITPEHVPVQGEVDISPMGSAVMGELVLVEDEVCGVPIPEKKQADVSGSFLRQAFQKLMVL